MANSTNKVIAQDSPPAAAWGIASAGWLVPGAGHFLQGRWQRGAIIAAAVAAMFLTGLRLGGHLYGFGMSGPGMSGLVQIPPAIADLGAGILYIVCSITGTGFAEHAERATFEYGNTFLLVAGLLNYLGMLDAFDIAAGRKP